MSNEDKSSKRTYSTNKDIILYYFIKMGDYYYTIFQFWVIVRMWKEDNKLKYQLEIWLKE